MAVPLPSLLRTIAGGPYNSPDIGSRAARGLELFAHVSANVGAFSLVNKLQAKDPVTGLYVDIPGAALAAIAAVTASPVRFVLYPGVTAAANLAVSHPAPSIYRVVATITGAGTSATFSVSTYPLM